MEWLVKQHKKDFDALFKETNFEEHCGVEWTDIFNTIKKMPTTEDYTVDWKPLDDEKIRRILIDRCDFSEDRIDNQLAKLKKQAESKKQKGLGDWF